MAQLKYSDRRLRRGNIPCARAQEDNEYVDNISREDIYVYACIHM